MQDTKTTTSSLHNNPSALNSIADQMVRQECDQQQLVAPVSSLSGRAKLIDWLLDHVVQAGHSHATSSLAIWLFNRGQTVGQTHCAWSTFKPLMGVCWLLADNHLHHNSPPLTITTMAKRLNCGADPLHSLLQQLTVSIQLTLPLVTVDDWIPIYQQRLDIWCRAGSSKPSKTNPPSMLNFKCSYPSTGLLSSAASDFLTIVHSAEFVAKVRYELDIALMSGLDTVYLPSRLTAAAMITALHQTRSTNPAELWTVVSKLVFGFEWTDMTTLVTCLLTATDAARWSLLRMATISAETSASSRRGLYDSTLLSRLFRAIENVSK